MKGTKSELRKLFLEKRESLGALRCKELDREIINRFTSHFTLTGLNNIHTYLPIKEKNEIDTYLLIRAIREINSAIAIAVPRMKEGEYELEHYEFSTSQSLGTNKWGIPEPAADPDNSIDIPELDMVIIPLLTFDISGHRVGYGKGYYDRFLSECDPSTLKIGLSRFEPVEQIMDINEHDVKMSACVTTETVYTF